MGRTDRCINGADNGIHRTANRIHRTANRINGTDNRINGTTYRINGTANRINGRMLDVSCSRLQKMGDEERRVRLGERDVGFRVELLDDAEKVGLRTKRNEAAAQDDTHQWGVITPCLL